MGIIKGKLTVMSFLQFFVWGAWLITVSNYWFITKGWNGAEFGAIFSTLGFSSLFMPAITGIIADRWINAERLYGVLHILGGVALACIPGVNSPSGFFWVIFAAMICYMPTIALSNSIAYNVLKTNGFDVIKVFPPIRVWGTIGFIAAMWVTNLTGNKASANQFFIAAAFAVLLGVFSFFLPKCPPPGRLAKGQLPVSENPIGLVERHDTGTAGPSWAKAMGLDAFKLFASYKMALFFIFSMFLGGALQLTNMYGDVYLSEFAKVPQYADSVVVKYSTIIMSISQISETLFILAIPFFLRRFGIKQVMLFSMLAWVLRFGFFAYGNPAGGLWMIIMSCIVYGMAFDFFNISGSLFVETTTDSSIRSSAQGVFMMMTNGLGSILGAFASGYVIDRFFTTDGNKNWEHIWLSFAGYALVIAIAFAVLFKHKHDPAAVENVSH
jgi:NHS family xanthosine MFS transporter